MNNDLFKSAEHSTFQSLDSIFKFVFTNYWLEPYWIAGLPGVLLHIHNLATLDSISFIAVILYNFQVAHPYKIHWSLCEYNLVMWPSPCESDLFFRVLLYIAAWHVHCICSGSSAGWQSLYQWSLWEYFISHPTFHSGVHGMESHRSKTALLLHHGTNCVRSGNTCGHICWYVTCIFVVLFWWTITVTKYPSSMVFWYVCPSMGNSCRSVLCHCVVLVNHNCN